MDATSTQHSEQEPPDEGDPPRSFPSFTMADSSVDEALRLMPPTLASEVRAAAASTSIPADFPLPIGDLHDLTTDLSIHSPADLEIFLDTEYIQLPDNPVLNLANDDSNAHEPQHDQVSPLPLEASNLQHSVDRPEPQPPSNRSFPPQTPQTLLTQSKSVHKSEIALDLSSSPPSPPAKTPPSIVAPSPVAALPALPTSAPSAESSPLLGGGVPPAKHQKTSGGRRSRSNSGPSKRPRSRTAHGSSGYTATAGPPIRIAPRGGNVGLASPVNVKRETTHGHNSPSQEHDQQRNRTESNTLSSVQQQNVQPQAQTMSKTPPPPLQPHLLSPTHTVSNLSNPQAAPLSIAQMPISLPPGTSNLIPIVPNLYPMNPTVMFPAQSSSPPPPSLSRTPPNQTLSQAQTQLSTEDLNAKFLQQQEQLLRLSTALQNQSQPQSHLTQLHETHLTNANASTASTAAAAPHFHPNSNVAAAVAAAADVGRLMMTSPSTNVGVANSAGLATAAMPHTLHMPNFLNMNMNVPIASQVQTNAAIAAAAVAAFQAQASIKKISPKSNAQQQHMINKSTQSQTESQQHSHQPPPVVPGQQQEPRQEQPTQQHQQHETQVPPGVMPMSSGMMFDPTNIYFRMAAQQFGLQLPTTANGQFPIGANVTNAAIPSGPNTSSESNLQSAGQRASQLPNVSNAKLSMQAATTTDPQNPHFVSAQQQLQIQQQVQLQPDRQATIITDGIQRNIPKQPAARLDRHPIFGRLQLMGTNAITKDTATSSNPSKANGLIIDSSTSGGGTTASHEVSSGKPSASVSGGVNGIETTQTPIGLDSSLNNVATSVSNASNTDKGSTQSKSGNNNDANVGSTNPGGGGRNGPKNESRIPKKRLVWTPELHDRFVRAIEEVGLAQAVPKTIVMIMNVEGLTTEHVKSHLQKYRNSLRKEADEEAKERAESLAASKLQNGYLMSASNGNPVKCKTISSATAATIVPRTGVSAPVVNLNSTLASNVVLNTIVKSASVTPTVQTKQTEQGQSQEKISHGQIIIPAPTIQTPAIKTVLDPNVSVPALNTVPTTAVVSTPSANVVAPNATAPAVIPTQPSVPLSTDVSVKVQTPKQIPSASSPTKEIANMTALSESIQSKGLANPSAQLPPTPTKTALTSFLPAASASLVPSMAITSAQILSSAAAKPTQRSAMAGFGGSGSASVIGNHATNDGTHSVNIPETVSVDEIEEVKEHNQDVEMTLEQRELELELMREKTLQMQLQLQKMVHRTVALDRKYQRECQKRQREQAMEREGSERSGRSNHGTATTNLSNRGSTEVGKDNSDREQGNNQLSAFATTSPNAEKGTILSAAVDSMNQNHLEETGERNDEDKALPEAGKTKRRRLSDNSDMAGSKPMEDHDVTESSNEPSAGSTKVKEGETEYVKLLRQQLEMGQQLKAQQALLNHLGKVTPVDKPIDNESSTAASVSAGVAPASASMAAGTSTTSAGTSPNVAVNPPASGVVRSGSKVSKPAATAAAS